MLKPLIEMLDKDEADRSPILESLVHLFEEISYGLDEVTFPT